MQSLVSFARKIAGRIKLFTLRLWRWYRGRRKWQQIAIAVLLVVAIIALFMLLNGGKKEDPASQLRTVTLKSLSELSGNGSSVSIVGTVRSVTEANILAQSGGTVRRVNAAIGQRVSAGYAIATLENAAESASVLQAEGAYDAAVAAKNAVSPLDAATAARNAYREAFRSLDATLESTIDPALFGNPTATGPEFLLFLDTEAEARISRERAALNARIEEWRANVASVGSRDPLALLAEAEGILRQAATFLDNLSVAASTRDSRATAAQIAAIASARASVNAQIDAIAAARASFRSQSTTSTASVDASVKSALGTLRAAQAQFEKTVIRAPIAGTVNFLPIRVGDYVTAFTHAATVAQNGALEIVAYVSEDDRDLLTVGSEVRVDESARGIITSISPALDPVTKQIEVRVAVTGGDKLVNGQSVRIALPNAEVAETPSEGPALLPLSAVKLRTDSRIVFTVDAENRLVAVPVETGEVRGDRIEITTAIDSTIRLVEDARGLAEGQLVRIAGE